MEKVELKITNPETKLSKLIDVTDYSWWDLEKTFRVYEPAGFMIKIRRS